MFVVLGWSPAVAQETGPPAAARLSIPDAAAPVTLGRLLDALREVCEINVPDEFPREQPVVTETPSAGWDFWHGLLAVCRQAQLDWSWEAGGLRLSPPAADGRWTSAASGILLVSAECSPPSNAPGAPRLSRVRLRFDVDPRLPVYFGDIQDSQVRVRFHGGEFRPFSPEAARSLRFDGSRSEISLNYLVPETVPATVDLEGAVTLRLADRRAVLSLPLTGALDRPRSIGDVTAGIRSWYQLDEELVLDALITLPASVAWESHQLGTLHREAQLRGREGEIVRPRSVELLEQSEARHRVRYRFDVGDLPLNGREFEYLAPLGLRDATLRWIVTRIPVGARR